MTFEQFMEEKIKKDMENTKQSELADLILGLAVNPEFYEMSPQEIEAQTKADKNYFEVCDEFYEKFGIYPKASLFEYLRELTYTEVGNFGGYFTSPVKPNIEIYPSCSVILLMI